MRGINKVILMGNLGRTPELKYTPEGRPVAAFSLATARTFLDKSGERQEEVEWHKAVAFGKLAEIIGQYCEKGRPIYLEGRLHTRTWTTAEGEHRSSTEVVVDTIQLLRPGQQPALADDMHDGEAR